MSQNRSVHPFLYYLKWFARGVSKISFLPVKLMKYFSLTFLNIFLSIIFTQHIA